MKLEKPRLIILFIGFICFVPFSLPMLQGTMQNTAHAQSVHQCELWGKSGEKWSPTSRVGDFSFAGYQGGDKAIPLVPVKNNVKVFGAKGDGSTDDTKAFKRAIAATNNGALLIPAGRYRLTNILEISHSNIVLRGAGQNKTTLFFAKSLGSILGTTPYGDGLLRVKGQEKGSTVAKVTANATRGSRTLRLSSTAGLRPGQPIRLLMKNPQDNSLGCHVYADRGCLNSERQGWFGGNIIDWVARVQSVNRNSITLNRPLRLDVRTKWSPQIATFSATLEEVGIENLSIVFPKEQYRGHHKEAGYHAIQLHTVFNSWVRNVTIVDADRGIELNRGSGFNTVSGITLTTDRRTIGNDKDGATGHYGFASGALTQDNLITDSVIKTVYVHNMAVASFANGNVYANIESVEPRFDHHGGAPYENLYTNILLTKTGQNFFMSGGNRADEPNGTRTVVWNVRKQKGSFGGYKGPDKLVQATIVGVDMTSTKHVSSTSTNWWVDRWRGERTSPPNLHTAQRNRRLGPCQGPDQGPAALAPLSTLHVVTQRLHLSVPHPGAVRSTSTPLLALGISTQ